LCFTHEPTLGRTCCFLTLLEKSILPRDNQKSLTLARIYPDIGFTSNTSAGGVGTDEAVDVPNSSTRLIKPEQERPSLLSSRYSREERRKSGKRGGRAGRRNAKSVFSAFDLRVYSGRIFLL